MKIIILAGGSGTRLYPLSTPEKPKQFLKLIDGKPLLITTIERFLTLCNQEDIVIVTGEKYRDLTNDCLKEHLLDKVNIVCEPAARNTAPAISLSVRFCKDILKVKADEQFFVAPSDHIIKPTEEFLKLVKKVLENTKKTNITLLGIVPTRPDIEYGYIKTEGNNKSDFKNVEKFKEKPSIEIAEQYLREGNYFWNAGMFGFNLISFETELENNKKSLYEFYCLGYQSMINNFESTEKISIDYAIAEKSKCIQALPMTCCWTDIGSFKAIYEFFDKDQNQNVIIGNANVIDCKKCLIIVNNGETILSEQQNQLIIKTQECLKVASLYKEN